ncbi:glucose 1-dehydrogenase 2-like [Cydia fagiglandana]|uniref:glucose 1-dehydrogenase 2-like n=1 Tax=Cydia fagiglandana TaxID=1458189 RepID=UPI002FEE5C73
MSFKNEVVIVTGSSGIGAATALMFAEEGADVALVARSQAKLAAVAKSIEALGRKSLIIQADLSKEAATAIVVPKTVEHFGKLDVVNNAGISPAGSSTEGTVFAYDVVMKTNVLAVIQLTSMVNISSVVALRPCKNPELLPYFVSKAALDHFARCTADVEQASSGVRVNTVNPGPVDDDINSNNNIGDPKVIRQALIDATLQGFIATNEDIGGVILFLTSDKAKSITGYNYVMDNGLV